MAAHTAELTAVGAPDRGAAATLGAFEAVVESGIEVPSLTREERDELRALLPWVGDLLGRLDGCGLPATLVHGDLHLGNVASEGERLVVYDWSDACLGMPAVDLPLLLGSLEDARRAGGARRPTRRSGVSTSRRPTSTWPSTLAPVASDVFQAVTYDALARGAGTRLPLGAGGRHGADGCAAARDPRRGGPAR